MGFYVYIYLDPRRKESRECSSVCLLYKPFYIGKGCRDRWQIHLRESDLEHTTNLKKARLIRKLKTKYDLRKYVVILSCETEADALALETSLIEEIGMSNLTNLTEGGIGMSGFKHSDEFRNMIRTVNSRPKPDGFGAKVSASKKGVPLTEAHKAALRGRKFTVEHRLKLSKAKSSRRSEEP